MKNSDVAKELAEEKLSARNSTIEYIIDCSQPTRDLVEDLKDSFENRRISKEDVEKAMSEDEEDTTLSEDDIEKYSNFDNPEEFARVLEFELDDEIERKIDEINFEVRGDITGRSYGSGDISSYVDLFRDRYKRLNKMIKPKLGSVYPINFVDSSRGGENVSLIGIVNEVRDTQKGNKLIILEDTKDETLVVYSDEEMFDKCDEVVEDEVIGITGTIADNGEIIFGDELHFPEVSPNRVMNHSDKDVKALLISDIHLGGREFAVGKWKKFVNWVRGREDIKYMVIAGDLVDGVGVYPEQEEELSVTSVEEQYELCARSLEQFPDDMQIIASPGNHDTPRLAEPQPQLKEKYKEKFPDNVKIVGNPAMVEIEGVKIQVYHGMSIKPISDSIPGLELTKPEGAMEKMLQKRHLNPIYGGDNRLAPEEKDYLIMEEVPDVLHTGHVHKLGKSEHRNVKMINSGCWQKRTEYQKQKNVIPDVGTAPVLNLNTGKINVKKF